MAMMTLSLLGGFGAWIDEESLPGFRTKKVQALLIYLAAEPKTAHRREELMELLWPGMPESSARRNLRQIIYHLRKSAPELSIKEEASEKEWGPVVPVVMINRQAIRLHPAADVEVDIYRFQQLLETIQDHEHLDVALCQLCRSHMEEAVEIYSGDFLADFYLEDSQVFEAWAESKRVLYRRQILDHLEVLTAIAIRQKDYPPARRYAERQVDLDDLHESGYRQLMEVLALSGFRSEALSTYEDCRRIMAEELGMAPSARTTHLYEQILAGDLDFGRPQAQGVRGYELKEEIGEGAYGSIHRAIQPSIGREVAIKVIRRRYANDSEFIRRFEAEAQTIARLEHPYIVPLYDYWRDPEGAFLAMRYLRGGSLLTSLESGPWGPERTDRLLAQIAGALSAAHQHGVVHRDIKPANILLDESGNAFLSDFGIAKDLTGEMQLTVAGAVLGTPDYISPEQIKNEPISPQTDVYSLGAVLYETLTGEKPFPDSSVANLIHNHLTEPIPLVSSSRHDIPPEIDAVIQKATAKDPADRYASALEMAEAFSAAVRGVLPAGAELEDLPVSVVTEIYNPYKGLRTFQEADADDFFGRDDLVGQLVARMTPTLGQESWRQQESWRDLHQNGGGRFVAVVGPSGSGKSSVVKAGLIPVLRSGALPGSEKWFVAEMVPGSHPLEELELALWPVAVDPPPSLVEPMRKDVRGMLRTIRRILPGKEGAQLLLVIDQFEELYTLVEDEEERIFFLDSLMAALSASASPLRVVITLRADFYDRPLQHQRLGQLIKENTEIVLPLTIEELTWAVQEPARRVGVGLESGLVTAIVNDVSDQPGALPLLQYAVTELFEKRQERRMTLNAYEEVGGVMGALGRRADEITFGLDKEGQRYARQLFLRLVTLGEGIEDTRRRVLRSELMSMESSGSSEVAEVLSSVIDGFGAARLLTFDHHPSTRQPTVEVAHEALLREWSQLRGWLDESRNDVRMQRLLGGAAAQWLDADRDSSYLLTGSRLGQFEGWVEGSTVALTQSERAFLEASVKAQEQRQAEEVARRQRELETARQLAETERARAEEQTQAASRLRRGAMLLAGALVVAAVLAVVAVFYANRASQNEEEAVANANLAATRASEARIEAEQRATAQAQAEREAAVNRSLVLAANAQDVQANGEDDLALALALEAVNMDRPPPEARQVLSTIALGPGTRTVIKAHDHMIKGVALGTGGQTGLSGSCAELGGDGVCTRGELVLWDLAEGSELRRYEGHTGWVNSVAFLPEGKTALSGSGDGTLILWDVETGEARRRFEGHGGSVNSIALSPASQDNQAGISVLSGSDDGSLILWDTASGEEVRRFEGHAGGVTRVAFSRDGLRALSGSKDDTLILWDILTGQVIQRFEGHIEDITGAAFLPDESRVLSSGDNTLRMWDVESGEEIRQQAFGSTPTWIVISPNGVNMLVGGIGTDIRLWDIERWQEEQILLGGRQVELVEESTAIVSPDGRLALSGSTDGVLRLLNLEGQAKLRQFETNGTPISSVSISADGRRLLTGDMADLSILWDVESGEALGRFLGDAVAVPPNGAALSSDGKYALVGSSDGFGGTDVLSLDLWDLETGQIIRHFEGHRSIIRSVALSHDGQLALSGSQGEAQFTKDRGNDLILWDVKSGEQIRRFDTDDDITSIVFNADGSLALTGSVFASNITLWDVATGKPLRRFEDPAELVFDVAFGPDEKTILSASGDGSLILWDIETGEVIRRYPGHGGWMWSVDVSPDGRYLLSGDEDGTIILWDFETGEELRWFRGHTGLVPGLEFSPDGETAFSVGMDGLVIQWQIADLPLEELIDWTLANRHVRELTCQERETYRVEPLCGDSS